MILFIVSTVEAQASGPSIMMRGSCLALIALFFTLALCRTDIHVTDGSPAAQEYLVGVGKADVTGPAAEGM